MSILTKAFGTKSEREIKSLWPIVKEIKTIAESIKSKSIVRHNSGKATEIHREIDIEINVDNPEDFSSMGYVVTNTIENSSEDPIEGAFIQDIIPYNYEISEISLNGKTPEVESNTRTMKEGLEHSWYIPTVEKEKSIEFKYHFFKFKKILPLCKHCFNLSCI